MTINEKVAHLKGVMEGMNFSADTNEGKLISLMSDILADIADELEVIEDDTDTLFDYCDELDEDLGEVEQVLFECEDDDCCCDCEDDDCCCECEDCTDEEEGN